MVAVSSGSIIDKARSTISTRFFRAAIPTRRAISVNGWVDGAPAADLLARSEVGKWRTIDSPAPSPPGRPDEPWLYREVEHPTETAPAPTRIDNNDWRATAGGITNLRRDRAGSQTHPNLRVGRVTHSGYVAGRPHNLRQFSACSMSQSDGRIRQII